MNGDPTFSDYQSDSGNGVDKAALEAQWAELDRQMRPLEEWADDQAGGVLTAGARQPILTRMADVAPEAVDYLWLPYLPLGKLTLLEGDPGIGKSFISMNLVAIETRGDPFPGPDGVPRGRRQPGSAIILSAEDGLADTIRVRLDAAGADVTRVHALTGIRTASPETGELIENAITLRDVDILEKAVERIRPTLIVVDPIQAYLGANIDMHRANETRPILTGLSKLAERHRCAILAIRHLTKGQAGRALYRGLGSIDFAAAARSILLAGRDPKVPDSRVLVHLKASNAAEGPAIGYALRDGNFLWAGVSKLTAADVLAQDPSADERGARDEAEDFLRDLLAAGPVASAQIKVEARSAGIAWATVRRAKKDLGLLAEKIGFQGTWHWNLPSKMPKGAEGAHTQSVSPFDRCEPLRQPGEDDE